MSFSNFADRRPHLRTLRIPEHPVVHAGRFDVTKPTTKHMAGGILRAHHGKEKFSDIFGFTQFLGIVFSGSARDRFLWIRKVFYEYL